jgi:hypothetical protein
MEARRQKECRQPERERERGQRKKGAARRVWPEGCGQKGVARRVWLCTNVRGIKTYPLQWHRGMSIERAWREGGGVARVKTIWPEGCGNARTCGIKIDPTVSSRAVNCAAISGDLTEIVPRRSSGFFPLAAALPTLAPPTTAPAPDRLTTTVKDTASPLNSFSASVWGMLARGAPLTETRVSPTSRRPSAVPPCET